MDHIRYYVHTHAPLSPYFFCLDKLFCYLEPISIGDAYNATLFTEEGFSSQLDKVDDPTTELSDSFDILVEQGDDVGDEENEDDDDGDDDELAAATGSIAIAASYVLKLK